MKHYLQSLQESISAAWDVKCLCNFHGEEFTYGEVATNIEKLNIFYQAAGLQKGSKIALCAKNSARWGIAFFSCNVFGAVAVPLLPDFTPDAVANLTTHSESELLFVDEDIFSKVKIEDMPLLKAVISCKNFSILYAKDDSYQKAMDSVSEAFAAKYPMGFSAANLNYPIDTEKEIAVINYTSGTTSAPKGVMLRYESISSNVLFGQDNLPFNIGDKVLSILPMAHMFGMMFEFIYPACSGATLYYLGKTPAASALMAALGEVKPIQLLTVPLVMEKVYKSAIKPVVDKPVIKAAMFIPGVKALLCKKIRNTLLTKFGGNLREIIMGGAPLNPEAESWFRACKLPYTVGYGMTECAPLISYRWWEDYVQNSCGAPVDRVIVRIDSQDPEHEVGEIQIGGCNVMEGYYKNPEATAAAFTEDGFLRSGDLGIMDKNGNIFIKGRSKNMILAANGQNVYPEEIEAVINNQPYVVESVVVSRESKIVALVYLDQKAMADAGMDAEAIDAYVPQMQIAVNKVMPNYSKIAATEVRDTPFEKTPKMSIKRFMYK